MLNILTFSDTHGSADAFKKIKKESKKADILVCAGDVSIFAMDLEQVLAKYNSIGIPIIMIAGNHETDDELKKASKGLENIVHVVDDIYSIGNYHFLCSSGNGFAYEDKAFEKVGVRFSKETKIIRSRDKNAKVILLTHAPPYKTKLDKMLDGHCGNKSIRRFIAKVRPDVAISGHIHENHGKTDHIGKTKIINPGPFGMFFKI